MRARTCSVRWCSHREVDLTVFRHPDGRVWVAGVCRRHLDVDLEPPEGYELHGGGDPAMVRELLAHGLL